MVWFPNSLQLIIPQYAPYIRFGILLMCTALNISFVSENFDIVCVSDFRHSLCFRLSTFFVFETFEVVFVWDFRHSFRWHYLTDTGHLKRRCSGVLLSCLGFCRRSEIVRQRRSSVDGKSAMALAIGFLYLPLCGVAWRGGGRGGWGGVSTWTLLPKQLLVVEAFHWKIVV